MRHLTFFFNCYLAAPRPNSGHYRGDSLTHPILITAFLHIRPKGHREHRSEVGSLSPAERLAGFEPGTSWLGVINGPERYKLVLSRYLVCKIHKGHVTEGVTLNILPF